MSNESQDSCLLDKTVLDKVLVGELPQLLPRPLLAVQKQLNLLLLQKYTRKFNKKVFFLILYPVYKAVNHTKGSSMQTRNVFPCLFSIPNKLAARQPVCVGAEDNGVTALAC